MILTLWSFLAGFGVFLFSIDIIEKSLQHISGSKFKTLLRKHTNHHFKSIIIGALSTAILQSSSVVTLMLLALVGSQIITLSNGLGIILGANLGTTFTGWIVTYLGFKIDLNILIYPLLAIGSLISLFFSTQNRIANLGRFILGFGLLLFALNMMKESTAGFQEYINFSSLKNHHYIIFALFGALFTAVIQSSSAMLAITLTALHGQILNLESACAIVIGADLGTTITVILGSLNGGQKKKQVAAAHFLFNLITDSVALILLIPLINFVILIRSSDEPLYALVTFYSLFNLFGIIIFAPFLNKFSNFLNSLFKEKEYLPNFDIDTKHPDPAILLLDKNFKIFMRRTFLLNSSLIRNEEKKEVEKIIFQEFGHTNFMECYKIHKIFESKMIEYNLKIQEQSLDHHQSEELRKILSAARNCVYSVKTLKDIKHNLETFKDSTDSSIQIINETLIYSSTGFYKRFEQILTTPPTKEMIFEEFISLLKQSEKNYMDSLYLINQAIQNKKIELETVPTFFNINREIYNSNYFMILALAEFILSSDQLIDFMQVPRKF